LTKGHITAARGRYTLYFTPPIPSKLPLLMGELDPHLIHGSLDPPESTTQRASRSVQPFMQGSRSWQTDRPTDHATSVTIGRTLQWRTTITHPQRSIAVS